MGGIHRKPRIISTAQFGEYSTRLRQMTPEQQEQEMKRLQKQLAEARQQDAVDSAMTRASTVRGDTTVDTVQSRNFFATGAQRYKKKESPIELLKRNFGDKCKIWKTVHNQYLAKLKELGRSTAGENIEEEIKKLKNDYAEATEEWEWEQANAMVDCKIDILKSCIKELEQPRRSSQGTRRKHSFSINTFG